jgi:hypothetical protein
MKILGLMLMSSLVLFTACEEETTTAVALCEDVNTVKPIEQRGACNETTGYSNSVNISVQGNQRVITSNSIPNHNVGLFGGGAGSLNPNSINPVTRTYRLTASPSLTGDMIKVMENGPQYEFGILLNGVIIDPEAAEPWPHSGGLGGLFSSTNWDWNLDAMMVNLGLDCNNAHVQPSGKYHYHGAPTLYLDEINANENAMTLLGYAADGFPIYNCFAYSEADNSSSVIVELTSSYRLKTGERPGDGENAPCGEYTGIYTNDFEYVAGLGDLDECNGRTGVTPEYPNGTYYYVITNHFPFVGRCLKGTPSNDFAF